MDKQPFQDYWDKNQCWGCGKNEHGLQIKSYWDENESVCIWKPHKHHKAGPAHILNGGIIGTLIDCHSICTAIANEYKLEERELDSKPLIWCVTASLKVDYYLPTPIDEILTIKAKIKEKIGRKTIIECSVFSKGKNTAEGEVLAIRVNPYDWFNA